MTLRTQIIALLLGTISVITLAILTASWTNTSAYAREQAAKSMNVATETFGQLLKSRETQLINSAELLTSDFGFKQAMATRDSPTIDSVLFNHTNRIQADLMFLTNLDGLLGASTHNGLKVNEPFPHIKLIESAAKQGGALSFVRVGEDLYQIVIVTVYAPVAIGFAGVGFKLSPDVANELKNLANIEVTFEVYGKSGQHLISTLPVPEIQSAINAPDELSRNFGLPFASSPRFVTNRIHLSGAEPDLGNAYLSVPLAPYLDEFVALRNGILSITLLALLVSVFLSSLYIQTLTRPLGSLVDIAARFSAGDYRDTQEEVGGALEVKTLFKAVNQMGSDIREREKSIAFQAKHDSLTRLLNRSAFAQQLHIVLSRDDHEITRWIIACFNIKGFKGINDSFGPGTGDICLQRVASRFTDSLGEDNFVGRYGGDEFVVLLSAASEPSVSPEITIRQTLTNLKHTIVIDELELHLDYSVGYTVYPDDGEQADDLLRRATIAVDRARQEQTEVRRYHQGEDEEHAYHLKLIRDLRHALSVDDGQLFMNYQPKMHLIRIESDKMEALIRWIHPEEGFVSPELFIALAEQSSLIRDLTNWVIAEVINERASWEQEFPYLQIAINVSARDLESENLLPMTEKLLATHQLPVQSLCFEMTERDMMHDAEKAIGLMQKFRAAGFDLSVDDYGIGQSSLSKLKHMPVDEIKIDKIFITHLEDSEDDQTIVRSTINLGHEFGLRVIAEGVESLAATELLRDMGCDYIQGYHLSRPLAANAVEDWLRQFKGNKSSYISGTFDV